jgi:hypothetical protein
MVGGAERGNVAELVLAAAVFVVGSNVKQDNKLPGVGVLDRRARRQGGTGWRRRLKSALVSVLSAPLVALTIVIGTFNLVQATVSAPWPARA